MKYLGLTLMLLLSAPLLCQEDSLLNLLEQNPQDTVRIKLIRELGELYYDMDSIELATAYFEEAIVIAERVGDDEELADVLSRKGQILRYIGQYDRSITYLLEAVEAASKTRNKELQAYINNNLGVSYRRKDEDNMALKYHLEALRLAEEIGNERILSYAYNSIGIIYTYQENYDEALDYYNLALELARKNNNKVGEAINLNSIAWVYEMRGDFANAIGYYKQSLAVNEESGNRNGIAICYNDLGKLYYSMGEYALSVEYYKRTLEITEEDQDRFHTARTRINIGQAYADLGDYERSLMELDRGLEYALQISSKRLIREAYDIRSRTHELMGDYGQALSCAKLAVKYRDSVYNEESSRQIAELRTSFEMERKDQENRVLLAQKSSLDEKVRFQRITVIVISSFLLLITLLSLYLFLIRKNLLESRQKIELQNKQLLVNEYKLNEALATRDKFFKIIAHDLRGNFNGILGFSTFLKDMHKELDQKEREEAIEQVWSASDNTYKLLENLLDWAKIQTNVMTFEPAPTSIKELVQLSIETTIPFADSKNVLLEATVKDDVEVIVDRQMIRAVIRNLVTNAIKFSKKGDKVEVQVEKYEGKIKVSVVDNGVGIPATKLEKLFDIREKNSTPGTNNEQGSGLGLLLCKEFVEFHKSDLRVESEEGKGSKFYFYLDMV